jgi:hypothetical protein
LDAPLSFSGAAGGFFPGGKKTRGALYGAPHIRLSAFIRWILCPEGLSFVTTDSMESAQALSGFYPAREKAQESLVYSEHFDAAGRKSAGQMRSE